MRSIDLETFLIDVFFCKDGNARIELPTARLEQSALTRLFSEERTLETHCSPRAPDPQVLLVVNRNRWA